MTDMRRLLTLFLLLATVSLWLRGYKGRGRAAVQIAAALVLLAACAGYLPTNSRRG